MQIITDSIITVMQNSLDTNTCTVCESKLGLRVGVSARVNSWVNCSLHLATDTVVGLIQVATVNLCLLIDAV